MKTCDVGSWFNDAFPEYARAEYVGLTVPTLEEVLARYRHRANYYMKAKNPDEAPGMEETLLALLDAYELRDSAVRRNQVLIQSFSDASSPTSQTASPRCSATSRRAASRALGKRRRRRKPAAGTDSSSTAT